MADYKNFKKIAGRYLGLVLAVIIIAAVAVLDGSDDKNGSQEQKGEKQEEIIEGMPKFPTLFTSKGQVEASVIAKEPSLYGEILIFDYAYWNRALMVDGTLLGTFCFDIKRASTYAHRIAWTMKNYFQDKKDVLLIGLGTGGLLKELKGEGFNIEVVEINPEMPKAADKYFILPENLNYRIIIDDGFHYLRNTEKKYDIIIVDLCDILESNAHLYTREFYKTAKSKLKDETGFLIQSLNISREDDLYHIEEKVANTIKKEFLYLYNTDRLLEEKTFAVLVFFAANRELFYPESGDPEKISLVLRKESAEEGFITQSTALKAAQWHLPVINVLRQQSIDNFGFDLRLK